MPGAGNADDLGVVGALFVVGEQALRHDRILLAPDQDLRNAERQELRGRHLRVPVGMFGGSASQRL